MTSLSFVAMLKQIRVYIDLSFQQEFVLTLILPTAWQPSIQLIHLAQHNKRLLATKNTKLERKPFVEIFLDQMDYVLV